MSRCRPRRNRPQPPQAATAQARPRLRPRAEAVPLGILQRVLLVEEPEQGSKESQADGRPGHWRLDNVSGGAGEPLDAAVRAEVDMPEAGLKVELLIRRNRDAALPASHTLELKFASTGDRAERPGFATSACRRCVRTRPSVERRWRASRCR